MLNSASRHERASIHNRSRSTTLFEIDEFGFCKAVDVDAPDARPRERSVVGIVNASPTPSLELPHFLNRANRIPLQETLF